MPNSNYLKITEKKMLPGEVLHLYLFLTRAYGYFMKTKKSHRNLLNSLAASPSPEVNLLLLQVIRILSLALHIRAKR
jgi:hypothetical protein